MILNIERALNVLLFGFRISIFYIEIALIVYLSFY
jgi:hypothetical protein